MTVEAAPDAVGTPVPLGSLVAGKYRLERVIGVGGMGLVVSARDEVLERPVAVKFMTAPRAPGGASGNDREAVEAVERFFREARAAARLESEHIARVYEVGSLPDGSPFSVIEFLRGRDVAQAIDDVARGGGALPIALAVDWILEALDAIAEAHAVGIVHRDLKPANLFLAQRADGSVTLKVLDFGISKMKRVDADDVSLTATHAILGSPAYMSPEQVRASRDVDARGDIWALGAILYELLSGKMPFPGRSVGEVFANVLSTNPVSLGQLRPGAPRAVVDAVHRCLERSPDDRFQSAGALAEALAPFGTGAAQKEVARARSFARRSAVPSGGGGKASAQTASPVLGNAPTLDAVAVTPGPHDLERAAYASRTIVMETGASSGSRGRTLATAIAAGVAVVGLAGGGWAFRRNLGVGQTPPEVDAAPSPLREPPPAASPASAAAFMAAAAPSATATGAAPPSAAPSSLGSPVLAKSAAAPKPAIKKDVPSKGRDPWGR